jgi:hypothetical protein
METYWIPIVGHQLRDIIRNSAELTVPKGLKDKFGNDNQDDEMMSKSCGSSKAIDDLKFSVENIVHKQQENGINKNLEHETLRSL